MKLSFITALVLLALGCRHEFPAGDARDGPVADTERHDSQTKVDARPADKRAEHDASPCAAACQQGASGVALASGMCVCDATPALFPQCTAINYCPSGWVLCSTIAYQTAFGTSAPPPHATDAWIGGCVSENIVYPSLGCVDCTNSACLGPDTHIFDCTGVPLTLQTPACAFALASRDSCLAVGQAANKAWWQALRADYSLSRVLCCSGSS